MLGMLEIVGKLVFSFAPWDAHNELKKKFLISYWNFFQDKTVKWMQMHINPLIALYFPRYNNDYITISFIANSECQKLNVKKKC